MRIGRNEIFEELSEHIRKFGGEPGEWCAGIAETDSKFQIQDAGSQVSHSRFRPWHITFGPWGRHAASTLTGP